MKKIQHILPWANLLLILLCFVSIAGLFPQGTGTTTTNQVSSNKEVHERLEQLEADIDYLDDDSINIRRDVITNQLKIKNLGLLKNETAVFSPKDKKFRVVDTLVGELQISLEDIIPYADGVKIIFSVGNPFYADLMNVKAKLTYGQSIEYYDSQHSEEDKSKSGHYDKLVRKTEQIDITRLKKGSWNKIEFILSPAKMEEAGFLKVELDANNISLFEKE